jgi:acyl-CoA synthetase (AMP-forming)/AMP-acid ligase II
MVPINVLYREREIAHIVADAQPKLIVATEAQRTVPGGQPAGR